MARNAGRTPLSTSASRSAMSSHWYWLADADRTATATPRNPTPWLIVTWERMKLSSAVMPDMP